MIWKIIIGFYIAIFIWLGYELYKAPLYPDDYDAEIPDENKEEH